MSFLFVVALVSQATLIKHILCAEAVGDLIVFQERPTGPVMVLLTLQTKYKASLPTTIAMRDMAQGKESLEESGCKGRLSLRVRLCSLSQRWKGWPV